MLVLLLLELRTECSYLKANVLLSSLSEGDEAQSSYRTGSRYGGKLAYPVVELKKKARKDAMLLSKLKKKNLILKDALNSK